MDLTFIGGDSHEALAVIRFCEYLGLAAEHMAVNRGLKQERSSDILIINASDNCEITSGSLKHLTHLYQHIFLYGHNVQVFDLVMGGGTTIGNIGVGKKVQLIKLGQYLDGLTVVAPANLKTISNTVAVHIEEVFIRAGKELNYFRLKRNKADLYVCANKKLPDLENSVSADTTLQDVFWDFIQLRHFLTTVAADKVWHINRISANIIIDDPYLKPQYGFFNYTHVAKVLRTYKMTMTIAFIPWNFKRSKQATINLLKQTPEMRLCIHGCDHVAGEYGCKNQSTLVGITREAILRMNSLRERTGLEYQKIMVFPQGIFSHEALQALRSCGLKVAINSGVTPSEQTSRKISEILSPAVSSDSGFPIINRYYPDESDLFLRINAHFGLPLLFVEHHEYFRNGPQRLAELNERIKKISPDIKWQHLDEIISGLYLFRRKAGNYYIKMLCDHAELPSETAPKIFRELSGTQIPQSIRINGQPQMFKHKNNALSFQLPDNMGAMATVELLYAENKNNEGKYNPTLTRRLKIRGRRILCDIRDDILTKNELGMELAKRSKKIISKFIA